MSAFTDSRRMLALLAASAILCAVVVLIIILAGLTDDSSLAWTNRDFSNYWIASRLVLEGRVQDLFQGQDIYFAHMTTAFGADFPWHAWSYPPHFLLLIWPLGLLPYSISIVVFLLVTLLIYLHAASLVARQSSDFPALFLLPFILCNVLAAQNGFMTAAMLLYGLALRGSRPLLAGIAIGLLTVKPQLGILLPLLLLFEQRWLVFVSASVTTVATVLLSIWIFGFESWTGYVQQTWPYQTRVMNEGEGIFVHMMLSTFGALRSLGYDAAAAIYGHAPVAIAALLVFGWTLFKLRARETRAASLVFATFLISPYSLVYDLGALVVMSASIYRLGSANLPGRLAYIVVASLPLSGPLLSLGGLPVVPLVFAVGWGALILQDVNRVRTASA
jgi:arabinofuranan 3-O-arabinosyltransferase